MIERIRGKIFNLSRYMEKVGTLKSGEGEYINVGTITGHIRELTGKSGDGDLFMKATHRLYTKDIGIQFKDRLIYEALVYDVIQVSLKESPFSTLSFYQVDLEAIHYGV